MDFLRAGFLERVDARLARRAAHDGVVHDDDALVLHQLRNKVQLHAHVEVADELRRLEKTAPDVVIADERHLVGNVRLLGIAERGIHAAVRSAELFFK